MATLKDKKVEDMQSQVRDLREAIRVFRFGAEGSRSRNVREGRMKRREIARLLTEINSRKVAQ
jgi:ribosomal protein L29